jgi:hypothetical protein
VLFAVHVALCFVSVCVSIHTRGSRSIRVLAFYVCLCVGALMYRAPGMPRSQENVSELMYLCDILRATRVY